MTEKSNITILNHTKASAKPVGGKSDADASGKADGANAAVATPKPPETASAKPSIAAAAKPPVAPITKPQASAKAVVTDAVAGQIWPAIAVGHIVLAPDYTEGDFNGWWPAQVISRTANEATLRWIGFEELPTLSMAISHLAVMHPAYRV